MGYGMVFASITEHESTVAFIASKSINQLCLASILEKKKKEQLVSSEHFVNFPG